MLRSLGCAVALSLATVAPLPAADPIYTLSLGDPARRDRNVTLALDTLIDTTSGATVDPGTLPGRLRATHLLLLGESHTSVESHRVQLQVLAALARSGRRVLIGLEMFPYPEQPSLEAWNDGRWDDDEFVTRSRWYEHWGYHWAYYRDLFRFARAHQMPLYAINAPRDLVTAVRQKGLASLPADQAAHLPPRVDVDSAEHMTFFKASFGDDDSLHGGMSDAAWTSMLSAQATWDATMAWNAVQQLRRADAADAIMVVLVGSGHVAYGLGIERQARAWFDGGVASVIAVPLSDDKGPIPAVRASYATYVIGVPREPFSAWPSLGLSTRAAADGAREVIDVEKDTPAAHVGLKVGDVILELDGVRIDSRERLSRAMAGYQWGDVPQVTIRRGEQTLTLSIPLRRTP
jgi:uncharacterized iron-regulated protein